MCFSWSKIAMVFILAAQFISFDGQAFGSRQGQLLGLMAEQAGSSVVTVTLRGTNLPLPQTAVQEEDVLVLRMLDTELPAGIWERRLETPLIPKVSVCNDEQGVMIQFLTTAPLEVKKRRGPAGSDSIFLWLERTPSQEPQNGLPPEPSQRISEGSQKTVTLDLIDADIYNALRLLATFMKLNVVISPSVPPRSVTMKLQDVSVEEALGYVTRTYGLSYALRGRTLMVGPRGELGRTLGIDVLKGYPIAYGDPQKIAVMLRQLTDIGAEPENLVIDERLRKLYIRGIPSQHREIENLLRQLDAPGSQVMIKARILEINENGAEEFKAIVNAVYDDWWASFSGDSFSGGLYRSRIHGSSSVSEPPAGGEDIDSLEIPNLQNTVWNLAGKGIRMLDAGISMVVQENKGKLLADPTVVVTDGHKATVKLVDHLKYVSKRDDAGNPTYDDEEVGPQLEIVPTVGRDGLVTVDVRLSTGEISSWLRGAQGEQIPQTAERAISSKVIVHSGEPFVVGGLFRENHARTISRVPILSDIPLLGSLFRSHGSETRRTQVIMILVPYILNLS